MSTNNKKTTTNKEATKTASTSINLEALQAQMAALIEQNAILQSQLLEMKNSQNTVNFSNRKASGSDDVTIVHTVERPGALSINGLDLNFSRIGEEFIISRTQFDQLLGKYRSWFEKGILAVSYKDIDVAAAKGLNTDKELGLDSKTLYSIGDMSPSSLENLWNSLGKKAQKESVAAYFKRKFMEGDPKFTSYEKVDLMNRLTEGSFRREQDELSGRIKINPTNL